MVGNAHTTNVLHDCPSVGRRARFESRLPARKRVCPECGGRGRVTPIRREQLLKRMKVEERALVPRPFPPAVARQQEIKDADDSHPSHYGGIAWPPR